MFILTGVCTSRRCGRHEFTVKRAVIEKTSTSGVNYITDRVVCPRCTMWAAVQKIEEVKA